MLGFIVDFDNQKIYMGKQFVTRSKIMGSFEFDSMMALKRDFPDYKIVVIKNM